MKTKYFLLAVVLCLIFSELCFAQWSTDPAENTRVNRWGINPKVTTDGAGGAIIAWEDDYAWGRDIVAQHVDSSGYKRWAEEGVVICNAELDQFMWDGDIVSDGSGGAFIAWRDHRRAVRPETGYQDSADIYLQHIDANGQPLWQENGIRISNGLYYAHHAKMAADDSGGVVIAWINQDTFSYSQFIAVFMQRISSSGEFLWSQDSAKIIAPNYDREPSLAILNDGNKGSIISCSEGIFRFTMQGELSWQVTDIPGRMTDYSIVSDGNGGAIYYYTNRLYPIYYLYLQRVNHHGEILWDDNGIFITTKIPRYWGTSLAPDGEHGAYISWIDSAYTYHYNRINSSGNLLWNDDSISCGIFMGGNNLLSDRNTNVISIYRDSLGGDKGFIQKLNREAVNLWDEGGILFSHSAMRDSDPTMISDNKDGAIIVWYERYSYERWGIFAQRLNKYGELGCITAVRQHSQLEIPYDYQLFHNWPNPFNQQTTIHYSLSQGGNVQLIIFNNHGEEVITLVNKFLSRGDYNIIWNGKNMQGGDVATGIYICQLKVNRLLKLIKLTLIR